MRVSVDRDLCVGAGQCVLSAEEVFDQDGDDGLVVLRNPDPSPAQEDAVRDAVDRCPAGAITLQEE
ncbi:MULTISPECIES: ferredoxin [unclassified Streptomyces]|uniref:ferredoxin n=1 Tax=unclassified Streptomyces TaxID=2593676 RepID=UPI001646739F|nr:MULTISPECIES: ferredoxin [unclassified Streptomyces]